MQRIKEKLKKIIIRIVFGEPVKGESLGEPTVRTVHPDQKLEFNTFFKTLNGLQ